MTSPSVEEWFSLLAYLPEPAAGDSAENRGVTTVALSVLDQVPVPEGSTAGEAIGRTLELAGVAERLGCRRYWLAEHHNTASLAGTAPEVLVGAVAAATREIRVGAGGVLLPYYSPLKVAEAFRTLHALYPGRIDLGVGRAAGTDPVAESALLASGGAAGDEHFDEEVADLVGLLDGDLEGDHPWAGVQAFPGGPGGPEVWLLGSSSHGGALAAALGLPFCFAHFITPSHGPQLVADYRQRFRPGRLAAPLPTVAVAVMCADTDAEARRQAATADLWRLGPEGRGRAPIVAAEAAAASRPTELEQVKAAQARAKVVVGDPERVGGRLVALAAEFGVHELVVVTVCHDPAARLRSYELVAEALAAQPQP